MGGVEHGVPVRVEEPRVEGGAAGADGEAGPGTEAGAFGGVEVGGAGPAGDPEEPRGPAGRVPEEVADDEGVRPVRADEQVALVGAAVGEGRPGASTRALVTADPRARAAQDEAVAGGLGQQQAQGDAVDVDAVGVQALHRDLAERPTAPVEPDVRRPAPHRGRRGEEAGVELGVEEFAQGPLRRGVEGEVVPAGRRGVGVTVVDGDVDAVAAQAGGQGEAADPASDDHDTERGCAGRVMTARWDAQRPRDGHHSGPLLGREVGCRRRLPAR